MDDEVVGEEVGAVLIRVQRRIELTDEGRILLFRGGRARGRCRLLCTPSHWAQANQQQAENSDQTPESTHAEPPLSSPRRPPSWPRTRHDIQSGESMDTPLCLSVTKERGFSHC